jgi:transcriptional regulator with XRE-family HTH domain
MLYTYLSEPSKEVLLRPLEGVRDLRERRMLSQQELADRAGVSLFTVQRIERGEGSVRPKTGRAIADALGVGVEGLLGKAQAPLWQDDVQGRRDDFGIWTKLLDLKANRWEEELRNYEAQPSRKTVRREIKDPFDHGRASEISQDILELTGFLLNEVVGDLNPKLLSSDDRREGLALLAALDRASAAADRLARQATPTPDEWLEFSQERYDEWREQRETAERRHEEIRRLTREIA